MLDSGWKIVIANAQHRVSVECSPIVSNWSIIVNNSHLNNIRSFVLLLYVATIFVRSRWLPFMSVINVTISRGVLELLEFYVRYMFRLQQLILLHRPSNVMVKREGKKLNEHRLSSNFCWSFETVSRSWHEQAASLIACNLCTVEDFEVRSFLYCSVIVLRSDFFEVQGV